MEDKKGKETLALARALLLGKGHGQFDLLPQVIESRFLEREKPIVLLKMIYTKLEVMPGAFNPNSFRNWLARYRKASVAEESFKAPNGKVELQQINDTSIPQPLSLTDPATLVREHQSLIRRPMKEKKPHSI